jgi:hypothetical protein
VIKWIFLDFHDTKYITNKQHSVAICNTFQAGSIQTWTLPSQSKASLQYNTKSTQPIYVVNYITYLYLPTYIIQYYDWERMRFYVQSTLHTEGMYITFYKLISAWKRSFASTIFSLRPTLELSQYLRQKLFAKSVLHSSIKKFQVTALFRR